MQQVRRLPCTINISSPGRNLSFSIIVHIASTICRNHWHWYTKQLLILNQNIINPFIVITEAEKSQTNRFGKKCGSMITLLLMQIFIYSIYTFCKMHTNILRSFLFQDVIQRYHINQELFTVQYPHFIQLLRHWFIPSINVIY